MEIQNQSASNISVTEDKTLQFNLSTDTLLQNKPSLLSIVLMHHDEQIHKKKIIQ